jgi:hypothetical protein
LGDTSAKTKLTSLGNSIRRRLQPNSNNATINTPQNTTDSTTNPTSPNAILRFVTTNNTTNPTNIFIQPKLPTNQPDQEQTTTNKQNNSNTYKNPTQSRENSHHQQTAQCSTNNIRQDTNSMGGSKSMQSTMNTKTIPFIRINDGTVRMMIRWRLENPDVFLKLAEDPVLWEEESLIFLIRHKC